MLECSLVSEVQTYSFLSFVCCAGTMKFVSVSMRVAIPLNWASLSLLKIFIYYLFYLVILSLSCSAQDIIPQPGIEPTPPALGAWILATGPPGKTLNWAFLNQEFPLLWKRNGNRIYCPEHVRIQGDEAFKAWGLVLGQMTDTTIVTPII